MIRVGFIGIGDEWLGGQNYLRNLLYAISQVKGRRIDPVVFLGCNASADLARTYSRHATVIVTPFLDRYSSSWIFSRIFSFFGLGQGLFENLLLDHKIEVIFHSPSFFSFKKVFDVVWIPDFQHIHLGDLFSRKELAARDKSYRVAAFTSDRIILSSQDAMKDFISFAPEESSKAVVLTFVGQVASRFFDYSVSDKDRIRQKYDLPQKFLYLPNQFWRHKNHTVAFEAVRLLRDEGLDVVLVCSGSFNSGKDQKHYEELQKFVSDAGLKRHVLLLGKIPIEDVFLLYAASLLVINPSLFEGWSTSVEECKSIGRRVLLSDIPVHREQAPSGGIYFDPYDPGDLAGKIRKIWLEEASPLAATERDSLKKDLAERTQEFGEAFQMIIEDLF